MKRTKKTYRCLKCGRKIVTRKARLKSCPLLEKVAPGLFKKAQYRCGGAVERIVAPKKAKPGTETKLAHAREALKRHHAQLRRTATLIKKWERRIVALERKLDEERVQTRLDVVAARAISFAGLEAE